MLGHNLDHTSERVKQNPGRETPADLNETDLQMRIFSRTLDVVYQLMNQAREVRTRELQAPSIDEGTRCRECGSPEAGGCYYCKAD